MHVGQPVWIESTAPTPAPAPTPLAVTPALGDELTDQESERIWAETHETEVPACTSQREEEGRTCEVVESTSTAA